MSGMHSVPCSCISLNVNKPTVPGYLLTREDTEGSPEFKEDCLYHRDSPAWLTWRRDPSGRDNMGCTHSWPAGQVKCTRVWKESKSWQKLKSETNKFWCVVFKCRNIIALIGSLGRECRGRHCSTVYPWMAWPRVGRIKIDGCLLWGSIGWTDRMVVPSAFVIKSGEEDQGGFCIMIQ